MSIAEIEGKTEREVTYGVMRHVPPDKRLG